MYRRGPVPAVAGRCGVRVYFAYGAGELRSATGTMPFVTGVVEFGVLGSMTIWHLGREVAVGSAQQRCVLAVLTLHADRVVSLDRLIDALWDNDPVPRTARNVVQRCVSDLRKVLAVDPTPHLVHRPPGYVLEVEPERVDLHRFRTLVDQARDADDRVVLLRRALALWRGEPLAGVPKPPVA